MANIKSAKKRINVIATKTLANKSVKSGLKTAIKKADAAVEANGADKQDVIRAAIKTVDQACAKGVIHRNTASRRKASLAKKLNVAQ